MDINIKLTIEAGETFKPLFALLPSPTPGTPAKKVSPVSTEEEPAKKVTKPKKEPVIEQDENSEGGAPVVITLKDIREITTEKCGVEDPEENKKNRLAIKKLLTKFGVAKSTDLDEANYEEYYTTVSAL